MTAHGNISTHGSRGKGKSMIHQLNLQGKDKVQVAIDRLKAFEPPEGYYLAFSGGKDSVVIKALADMAQVKYDAHYRVTSVDPPELVQFIKNSHPDVARDRPLDKDGNQITMWNSIVRHSMPPTRIVRYCCKDLKEDGGVGRFVITGVRWAESSKRANRGGLELAEKKSHRMENHDPDNPNQQMIHQCLTYARKHLNPIIDWTDEDVWEFIHEYNVPYCSLYDEGFTRLGCIGCPMARKERRAEQFKRYPKFKRAYIKAFEKMAKEKTKNGNDFYVGYTGEDIFNWWIEE